MSVCRRHIRLVNTAPVRASLKIAGFSDMAICGIIIEKRIIPYPPSFRRIAARTIEPATGASTWAFGSHRCTENSGSFTRNAVIRIKEKRGD